MVAVDEAASSASARLGKSRLDGMTFTSYAMREPMAMVIRCL